MKNNKKILGIIVIAVILITIIVILSIIALNQKEQNSSLNTTILTKEWSRQIEGDTEYISFSKDGNFSYFCACGNSVDDYDLCDTYTYDKKTNKITLNCDSSDIIDKITIVKSTEYELVLEFNGETREFHSEDYYLLENPLEFADIEFKTIDEDITFIFHKDGTFEAFDNKEGGFPYSSDICFTWTYDKEQKEINLECNDEKERTIKIVSYDKDNKDYELELNITYENKTVKFNSIEE
ncbi:MAG: hypothetical protein ACI4XM_00065 [Candidatus Coprovivens sp.]